MDPDAKLLSQYNADPHIFVPAEENGIGHRMVASKLDHVGYNQGIDALLLARRVNLSEPNFHVGKIRESQLLAGWTAQNHGIVPIYPQQRLPRLIVCDRGEGSDGLGNAIEKAARADVECPSIGPILGQTNSQRQRIPRSAAP